ncbi:protein GAMETE EXPRESSED 1 [Aristolochia californica]|uniref:protein GAMETE EXPRESSED 1 n=1 Tax=Aristolochia californica TaxID=171875 RepID=UPI0035E20B17
MGNIIDLLVDVFYNHLLLLPENPPCISSNQVPSCAPLIFLTMSIDFSDQFDLQDMRNFRKHFGGKMLKTNVQFILGCENFIIVLLVLLSSSNGADSWGWFSSAVSRSDDNAWSPSPPNLAEFTLETFNDPKGMKLVERANRKLASPNSCWQAAYQNLFAGCAEIVADKEKQSRLAWYLSDCFQQDSGRPAFPSCDPGIPMLKCLKILDEFAHKIYLEFFLETNSICHQLQTEAFKHETERLVNDLKETAEFAEDKLNSIEERSNLLLKSSNQIHDSLVSIDLQSQLVVQMSKEVEEQIDDVLNHSKAIFEQSQGIVASQSDLQEGQAQMKEKMDAGMAFLQESYQSLGDGIKKLKKETANIEKEINEVGDSMSLQMQTLQTRADDIGNIAGVSLEKQKLLLDGQSMALEGLNILNKFQTQALEESRATLQNIAEYGHKQQEELLRRQEQLQETHNHLIQNSRSILAAQEAFESKQASMFTILEQLFTVLNSILLESRFIKTFFYYLAAIVFVYWITSTKQTCGVRAHFYLSICFTFLVEFTALRFWATGLHLQPWIESNLLWVRSTFLLFIALFLILYSISTYRDYELLNNQMLLTLSMKVNTVERNMVATKKLLQMVLENDVALSSWIDTELPEDEGDDPDYALPEEVAENSITTTTISRKYDLRPRLRQ